MVHGIYAGDARALSVRACFPAFYEMEKQAGSLIRAALRPGPPPPPLPTAAPVDQPATSPEWMAQVTKASMLALHDGLETLVHALVRRLQADGRVDLRLGQRAAALAPTADGRVAVRLVNGPMPPRASCTNRMHLAPQYSRRPGYTVGRGDGSGGPHCECAAAARAGQASGGVVGAYRRGHPA